MDVVMIFLSQSESTEIWHADSSDVKNCPGLWFFSFGREKSLDKRV